MKATEIHGFAPSREILMLDLAPMNMKWVRERMHFLYQIKKAHAKP